MHTPRPPIHAAQTEYLRSLRNITVNPIHYVDSKKHLAPLTAWDLSAEDRKLTVPLPHSQSDSLSSDPTRTASCDTTPLSPSLDWEEWFQLSTVMNEEQIELIAASNITSRMSSGIRGRGSSPDSVTSN